VETLDSEVATRGVYVRKVLRAGEELPLGSKLVIEPGDVLTLIGAKRHVERVAARLGSVERTSHATDVILLCLAIGIGGLIGLPALHLTRLSIGLGLPVGVLVASLVVGWLHSIRPVIARVPESVIWLLDSLGLTAFVATIGINAGPSFVYGIRSTGLVLLLSTIVVCAVPYLVTILVGYYGFRLDPGILLGICAGGGTLSPGLAAVQEAADSRIRILGYGVSYALGAVLFALWGSVIVTLVQYT
jgi:putative transport protein